ncbi:YqgE/AlgH family protein [Babesia caballi]|uniref:YqgE/AlgH family protein n=1 Tax=Babesia caballi TaxID=5871 RepID=A0AAV4LX24_BABCB|nr:YqgE/AlgH family protein [Babesia caballi]
MCAPLICVNIRGQEPLAVEVRSQGATAKRQIAPSAAIIVTPPVDIGEGLVVKRKTAEEDPGALSSFIITTHFAPLGFIVERRICYSLKLGDEGSGGVADRGEDGGVGVILKCIVCFKLVDITVYRIRKPLEEADDEVQHGVTDLVPRDVSGQNAAAGDFRCTVTITILIPNELLKPLGQLGNETTRTSRCQSLSNLIKLLLTKPGIRHLNFTKKLLNLRGEAIGTILAATSILPRDPQGPVYRLLQTYDISLPPDEVAEGGLSMSKGGTRSTYSKQAVDKGLGATEVEDVGSRSATACGSKGGEGAGEGGDGGGKGFEIRRGRRYDIY